jgi:hypothetical protein
MTNQTPVEYLNLKYIHVKGDALPPSGFWTVTLLTQAEYDSKDIDTQNRYRLITITDIPKIEERFK